MTDTEQREAARQFFYKWNSKGKEDEDARSYWIDILVNIFGVDHVTDRVEFEKKVVSPTGTTNRIDVYIPETRVLIEQKSLGIPLDKPQAGHGGKTPYEQAKEYDNYLPYDERARWIIVSNFAEIWVYDMNVKKPEPFKICLADLQTKYTQLEFLVKKEIKKVTDEMQLSIQAGELVGKIHDRFLVQYNDPLAKHTQRSLNILCVRLVFCLYAEDAGLFGSKNAFEKYIDQYQPKDLRMALISLFKVLDTPDDQRADMYLPDDLAAFPYVNGGLFADENIVIPKITDTIKDTLIESSHFNWADISPTIFGAVFESTLNPETRRSGGMHYTSIENIHKVIDPLFLDDLKAELEDIKTIQVPATQRKRLDAYQEKLASLTFLDPACGSGNFLTETFLSLRRLENYAIKMRVAAEKKQIAGQMTFGMEGVNPIKISISQFYGIEINDFAVKVAQTALWIAESQMLKETEDIIYDKIDFLPLKTNAYIVEGNALRMDWAKVVSPDKLSYIMGNPPFHGFTFMSVEQKNDMDSLFPGVKNLDYVCAWYKRASDFIAGTNIEVSFVSTNSITQGETVGRFWEFMKDNIINYAYTTFVWDSEATLKAKVHCVIIGFSKIERVKKVIYSNDSKRIVTHINPYLMEGEDIIVTSRNKPLCNVPKMIYGNKPADGGYLIIEDEDYDNFIEKDPNARQFIKPLLGASEYIKGKKRWCIWLEGVNPSQIRKSPLIMERVSKCKAAREASIAAGIRKFAQTPTLFAQRTQPVDKDFIIVPRVSSQNRRYVPMGFIKSGTIVTDRVQIIPDANLYDFGIIISNVHMAWMRVTCMRLKSDYSYSKDIVYNNFPWPTPTDDQKTMIEQTAQAILDARALYPDSSLADLYDPLTMPPELQKAHTANDVAVMKAYGMPIKGTTEADCVAWLMRLYQELVDAKQ